MHAFAVISKHSELFCVIFTIELVLQRLNDKDSSVLQDTQNALSFQLFCV